MDKLKKEKKKGQYYIFWTQTSISLFFIMQIFIVLSFLICFETMTAMLVPNEVRLFSVFDLFLFATSHSLTIKQFCKKISSTTKNTYMYMYILRQTIFKNAIS